MTRIEMNEAKLISANAVFSDNRYIAIIGMASENNNTGAAYVYKLVSGVWTQSARIASEVASSKFGYSVSINSIGDVAIIGAPGTGVAYVYKLVSSIWTMTAKLVDTINNNNLGYSVSMNSAGDVAIIGASYENSGYENSGEGAAYIYNLVLGMWIVTARLATGIVNSRFGSSVSINGIGNIAIIGAVNENSYTGGAYIYTLVSGIWTKTVKLASGIVNNSFGSSVSINSTGNVAIVGAPSENYGEGAVYVYTLVERVWCKSARIANRVANSYFGRSVSINGIGNIALIGTWTDNNTIAAACTYILVEGVWTHTA